MSFISKNTMKEKLERGDTVVGLQLRSRSPMIAEIAGLSGYDFVYIETEHFVANDETIESTVRAAMLTDTVPLVRIPTYDEGRIMQLLDMGVMGLILPHVDTPQAASKLVNAGKYPPIGRRGSGFTNRASNYGVNTTREEYKQLSNKNTMIIPMIESLTGVNNVEGILDAGIDMLRIGRNDLSESMGVDMKDRLFNEAVEHVINSAKERGIAVGTSASSVEHVLELRSQGFRMISYSSDLALIARHIKNDLDYLKTKLKRSVPR